MKVEHLSVLGNSVIRDTEDILPETVKHFKIFQQGSVTAGIRGTSFNCKITVEAEIGIFNIQKGEEIAIVNVCCFQKHDTEPAMLYVRSLLKGLPFYATQIVREPSESSWLYSIVINPFITSPQESMIAGEIEIYIYDAIWKGLGKNTAM